MAVVGLVLVGLRFATVPFGSTRILGYLMFLTTLGLTAYLVFYMKKQYAGRLEAYEARVLKARYAPKPKPKPAANPVSIKRRAKGKKAK